MGLLGILLSLGLLMYLAYRGFTVLILAPVLALLAVLMSGELPILATYTQVFMKSLGNFVIVFFATPVMRTVERMEQPSTKAEMTRTRSEVLKRFILTIMLERSCNVNCL